MSETGTQKSRLRPVYELVPDEQARKALDVSEYQIAKERIQEIASLIWHPSDASEAQINVGIARAIEHYNSLNAADGAEAMLAKQMVATYSAAIECMRRVAIPDQFPAGRDQCLNQAVKLMTLYNRQLETLNKHRGKGQQKVTVEHVHVAEGGQAIVGHVETRGDRRKEPPAPRIELQPASSVDLETPQASEPVRDRTK